MVLQNGCNSKNYGFVKKTCMNKNFLRATFIILPNSILHTSRYDIATGVLRPWIDWLSLILHLDSLFWLASNPGSRFVQKRAWPSALASAAAILETRKQHRLVTVSQVLEVEKRSGNLVALFLTQLKHLKPHWILGRSHGLSTRLRSGWHFANLYYYFAACRQTQRKFAQTALQNGRHGWSRHTEQSLISLISSLQVWRHSRSQSTTTHAKSKPGTLTNCVL